MLSHLHFVQSVETLEGGGLGKAAADLCDSMAAQSLDLDSLLISTSRRRLLHEGESRSYFRFGPTRFFFSFELLSACASLVEDSDIVHGHGFYVATNWLLGRQARLQDRPLVYHPHGMFEPWILARSRYKKRIAHLLFENANFKHASLWRALTEKEANQIRSQGIKAPIVVAPNGIDLTSFDDVPILRAKFTKEKTRKELLFLARLHPKKGLPLLVSAWAQLSPAKRRGWKVILAGPDELGHKAEVEALVKSAGLQGDFDFIGSVSGEAKLEALARADAFILPSHSEGFSVAILEALACRLPVIATTACNFPELSSEGGGWVVDDNVEQLTQALEELISTDETSLSQRGNTGRKLVEERFTWPHIARTVADACNSILIR